MRHYKGYPDGRVNVVEDDGSETPLPPRHDLANHSPDGFAWGYGGSGPAQLALAMAVHATCDDARALKTYQRLKSELVARLRATEQFALPIEFVQGFVEGLETRERQERMAWTTPVDTEA